MRYIKFILIGLVIVVCCAGSLIGILKWKEYKHSKLSLLYREEVEDSLSKPKKKIYNVQDGYLAEKKGLVIFLEVKSKSKTEFMGTLHVRYIEDNFKSLRLVKQNLKATGKKQRDNNWRISFVDEKYKSHPATALLKSNEFTIKDMPVLEKQTHTLKVGDNSTYSTKVKKMVEELNAQTAARNNNVFTVITDKSLPKELKTMLDSYPLNTANADENGRTVVYIHSSYLSEITKRINVYLSNIDRAQKNLQSYIKSMSPLIDYQFEAKIKTTLDNITKEADKVTQLTDFYGDVVSFYEKPSKAREATFNSEDKTTVSLIDTLLSIYNSDALTKISTRQSNQQNLSDVLYKMARNKIH